MDLGKIKNVYLPNEITDEVLSRLSVKSLLRLMCVSKLWLSLISSQRFVESHLRQSAQDRAFSHHRVIFECEGGVLNQCSLQQLLSQPSSIELSPIYDPTNNQQLMQGKVIGCCNGLICIHKDSTTISLWNPATRISIELPKLDSFTELNGFGWDGKTGAYKVFVYGGTRESKVYDSTTNSWKTVDGYLNLLEESGVFACGKIHWFMRSSNGIESWDLESEEFGSIELPFQPPEGYYSWDYKLAEIGGCLHLLCVHFDYDGDDDDKKPYAVVWVMKEETGWLKLFSSPLSLEHTRVLSRSLFVGGPNGEILVIYRGNYLVYYPKEDVLQAGENENPSIIDSFVYVESLVSPNFTTPS